MFARPSMKTAALGAAALSTAALLLAPSTASAQVYSYQGAPQAYGYDQSRYGYDQSRYGYGQSGYGYDQSGYGYGQDRGYDRYDYDQCRTDRRQRQGAGVAVGATFGAVVGSQLGARGRRTEGSVLGAVIGGALGAAVGGDSARRCDSGYSGHVRYDNRDYGSRSYGYEDRGYSSQRYGDPYRADDRYDDRDYRYQPDDRYRSDCRPVAVSSRDRYGRVVTRYQQTC